METQAARTLTLVCERNEKFDHEHERIQYSGMVFYWPEGNKVDLSVNQFCQIGVRTLIGRKHISSRQLLNITLTPVAGLEAPLPRLGKGSRSRRLFIRKQDNVGIMHLINGMATGLQFYPNRDDARIVEWLGMNDINDGDDMWFDLVVSSSECNKNGA